jgi:hypothetical protein
MLTRTSFLAGVALAISLFASGSRAAAEETDQPPRSRYNQQHAGGSERFDPRRSLRYVPSDDRGRSAPRYGNVPDYRSAYTRYVYYRFGNRLVAVPVYARGSYRPQPRFEEPPRQPEGEADDPEYGPRPSPQGIEDSPQIDTEREPALPPSPKAHAQPPSSDIHAQPPSPNKPTPASDEKIVYTCPMHPDVKSDKPGSCPKCGMDLVAVKHAEKASRSEPTSKAEIDK